MNLREGTKEGEARQKDRDKLTEKTLKNLVRRTLSSRGISKKLQVFCAKFLGKTIVLPKHSKCLKKIITFVYGLGIRDS
tara:strand:- start:3571 stop:3807 length:237 start_codon:yes stop_codon:yes gene_type:complete